MQRFPCPFCGLRDEREFHFSAEAGKSRPNTTQDISETEWGDYLYAQANPVGVSEEIWVHIPCREVFLMKRNTVTMEVLSSRALRQEHTP